jgi:hypothetical protein
MGRKEEKGRRRGGKGNRNGGSATAEGLESKNINLISRGKLTSRLTQKSPKGSNKLSRQGSPRCLLPLSDDDLSPFLH